MKIINKLLASAIVIAQIACVSGFAQSVTVPDDVKGTDCERAVRVLMSLGLMNANEDGSFAPDSNLTRAELAAYTAKILGLDTVAQGGENNQDNAGKDVWEGSGLASLEQQKQVAFKDVSDDYWAAKYIRIITGLKIMNGYDKDNFAPEQPVTYEQAVAALVRALGYDIYARHKGGYPAGYLVLAAEKKLTQGVNGTVGEPVKRGTAAKLIFNALSVDILEHSTYGDSDTYYSEKNKTLLTEKLNIVKDKGIVTAVPMSGLSRAYAGVSEDYIEIDSEKYKANGLDVKGLLGYKVTYYYTNIADKDHELLCVDFEDGDNIAEVFDTVDFESYIDGTLKYSKDKTEKKAEVFDRAPVIYNGVYYDIAKNTDFGDFTDKSGSIKLLDSDGDGQFDVVFVTAYQTYVVKKVNVEDSTIFVKDVASADQIEYDQQTGYLAPLKVEDSSDKKYIIYKDGKPGNISSVKEGNILSVAESMNTQGIIYVTLQISTQMVKGSVSESSEDGLRIGENSYKLVPGLNSIPPVGSECSVYLDVNNKVAYYEISAAYDYAYLLDAAKPSGFSDVLELKLFTKKNEKVEVIRTSANVNLNDQSTLKADELLAALSSGNAVKQQVIAYGVDKNGAVNKLYTAKIYNTVLNDPSSVVQRYPVGVLSTYLNTAGDDGPGFVKKRTASKNNFADFMLSKSGFIFDLSSSSQDDWQIRDLSYIKDSRAYTCAAYNLRAGNVADIMLIPPPAEINNAAPIGDITYYEDKSVFISKITLGTDEEGNQIYNIEGYKYGTPVKYTVDAQRAKAKMAQMQVGDCWQFEIGKKNRIIKMTRIFSITQNRDPSMWERKKITSDDAFDVSFGLVKEVGEDSIILAVNANNVISGALMCPLRLNQWGAKTTAVYWYDCKTKKLEMKTTNDIAANDLIMATGSWGAILEILVIKNY